MLNRKQGLNLLVTGVGGDIGQGVLKCLQEIGYHSTIVGCDIDDYAPGKFLVDVFYHVPRASHEQGYIEIIDYIVEKYKIDYIIPSTEHEIKVFNKYRDHYKNRKIGLLINNELIVDTFLDKYSTVRFFEENHIPFPKTFLISEYNTELSYPLILKLKESAGSKGVFTIHDEQELSFFKGRYIDAIIQEKLSDVDNEYTIGVFSNGETVHHIMFKRYLGLGSLSRYVEYTYDPNVNDLVRDVARLTGLRGSINIQVRKVGDKYVPFEINPRISSTVYFRHYFGFQDVRWWLDYCEGNPIEYTPRFNKGIGVRTVGEVFFDLE